SRPAWSAINGLPILSGAFGIWSRDVVVAVGGYTPGHMGEDLDLTMRVHRYMRESGDDYRLVYSPAAVVWTEVPPRAKILRRQRIRWHRGLMTAVRDFRSSFFNPRHGTVGMVSWPVMVLFEFLAPVVEFLGWVAIPLAVIFGAVSISNVRLLFVLALLLGAITSLAALLLDERYGYFNDPKETLSLLTLVFVENVGLRQVTVWWRIRAMLGGAETRVWGDMERRGATALARKASGAAALGQPLRLLLGGASTGDPADVTVQHGVVPLGSEPDPMVRAPALLVVVGPGLPGPRPRPHLREAGARHLGIVFGLAN